MAGFLHLCRTRQGEVTMGQQSFRRQSDQAFSAKLTTKPLGTECAAVLTGLKAPKIPLSSWGKGWGEGRKQAGISTPILTFPHQGGRNQFIEPERIGLKVHSFELVSWNNKKRGRLLQAGLPVMDQSSD